MRDSWFEVDSCKTDGRLSIQSRCNESAQALQLTLRFCNILCSLLQQGLLSLVLFFITGKAHV